MTVNLVTPTVMVAACTVPTQDILDKLDWDYSGIEGDAIIQALPEFGGRACYQSWDKPNPETATNAGYLLNIQKQRHFSVLEHSSVSLYLEGISRSLSHEFVRHRHFSYSQLSQRYVDSTDVAFVLPPALEGDDRGTGLFKESCEQDLEYYQALQEHQREKVGPDGKHLTKKQARESARSVLPNGAETKILVTGNFRAWMEFLIKRDNPAADAEIQRLAKLVVAELQDLAPSIFSDTVRASWDDSFAQRKARA